MPERLSDEQTDDEPGIAPLDREALGRVVRETWIAWAREQPSPKPSWLVPWEGLAEPDREVDRRIGETVAQSAIVRTAADALLRPLSGALCDMAESGIDADELDEIARLRAAITREKEERAREQAGAAAMREALEIIARIVGEHQFDGGGRAWRRDVVTTAAKAMSPGHGAALLAELAELRARVEAASENLVRGRDVARRYIDTHPAHERYTNATTCLMMSIKEGVRQLAGEGPNPDDLRARLTAADSRAAQATADADLMRARLVEAEAGLTRARRALETAACIVAVVEGPMPTREELRLAWEEIDATLCALPPAAKDEGPAR